MSVKLYMDVQIPRAITKSLRLSRVDILTAQEDGTAEWDDIDIINRATLLNRVLFTEDTDFLRIAAYQQANSLFFTGVIFLAQKSYDPGRCIADLEYIAQAGNPIDFADSVTWLPLR